MVPLEIQAYTALRNLPQLGARLLLPIESFSPRARFPSLEQTLLHLSRISLGDLNYVLSTPQHSIIIIIE